MKKGKQILGIFSALVLAAIVLMAVRTVPSAPGATVPVSIRAGNETADIWTADGQHYYAFLPGTGDEIRLIPEMEGAALNGIPLPCSADDFDANTPYLLTWQQSGETRRAQLELLPAGDNATLFLDTQSGSMEYIHARKGNAERGSLRLYDADGSLNFSGSLASLRGRGNSTWVVHEKKPYSLELTEEADLLGMGAAKKWVLLADALDPSGLRNKTVYDFAAQLGFDFTPETRWAEVYLNGEYAGLYLLCEKIEDDPRRLNLGPDGSLVCMDRDIRIEEDTDPYFTTDAGQCLQVRRTGDMSALIRQFQALEDALLRGDPQWQTLLDLDSWVNKYLVEEVFGSYDAGFQSQYFYSYEPSGRIYAGPVWDFDSSLGNPSVWSLNSPNTLFAWRPQAMAGYAPSWYHSLYNQADFRQALILRYRDTFLPLLQTLTDKTLPDYARSIEGSFDRNRIRWDVQTPGIAEEARFIAGYLTERTEFLSRLWLEGEEFCILRLRENGTGGYYGYYALEPGSLFTDLPPQEDGDGWFLEDTGEVFDPAQPVTEDLFLISQPPAEEPEEPEGESLKDVILRLYHYVPLGALMLMGAVLVLFGIRKSRRSRKKEPVKSK